MPPPTPPPDKALFYPAWISAQASRARGTAISFGPSCDGPGEARRYGKDQIASGNATLAFVVQFADGERTLLESYTEPVHARDIIAHYREILSALE